MPFIALSPSGELTLRGNPSFQIYLNGRPYDIAMQEPTQVLRTIPAAKIKRIEVITDPNDRFDVGMQPIVNIITKSDTLDGYSLSIGGSGGTRPDAGADLLFLSTKGNIETAFSYKYSLQGQRGQKIETESDYLRDESGLKKINSIGHGSGNVNSHIGRLMLKWKLNNFNSLYADAHTRFQHISSHNYTHQEQYSTNAPNDFCIYESDTRYHDGTFESNLIFRNYFRNNPTKERCSIGYRYTYTPDRKKVYQTITRECGLTESLQTTNGGMNEHSVNLSYSFILPKRQTLYLKATGIFRERNTSSSSDNPMAQDNTKLRYNQNIGCPEVSYVGIFQRVGIGVWLRGDFEHVDMMLPMQSNEHYRHTNAKFLPTISLSWVPSRKTSIKAYFSTRIRRPSIAQLNPFRLMINTHDAFQGNPNLYSMTKQEVAASVFMTFGPFSAQAGASFSKINDLIQNYQYQEENVTISTWGNISKAYKWGIDFNISWQPISVLYLSANGDFGRRKLESKQLQAKQFDWQYNLTAAASLLLPRHWNIGVQYGIYKDEAPLFQRINSLDLYSLDVSKSFLNGNLSLSARVQNPFAKYINSKTVTSLETLTETVVNHIISRTFSLSLYYTFGSGRKTTLRRDESLKNADLDSGVD